MFKNNDLLGSAQEPYVIMYLDSQPRLSADMFHDGELSIPALITENGNHWRKICSIFAKLMADHIQWQSYRDQQLLKAKEAISFGSLLASNANLHIVCGKAAQTRLGLCLAEFELLPGSDRLYVKGNVLCTPYPDYRQFPNREIDIARVWMREKLGSL